MLIVGFPGGTVVESTCQSRRPGDSGGVGLIPGLGRSTGVGNGNSLQYSCLENPMERSLVGFSPWDLKESDTIKHTHTQICLIYYYIFNTRT